MISRNRRVWQINCYPPSFSLIDYPMAKFIHTAFLCITYHFSCLASLFSHFHCPGFVCVCAQSLGRVQHFVTPWTVAHQVPLFMEFSRQECWNGLPFPPPGDLPDPGIKPASLESSPLVPPGKSPKIWYRKPRAQSVFSSVQFSSITQWCLTLCDPMNHSMPGLLVHHRLLESTQTHVH